MNSPSEEVDSTLAGLRAVRALIEDPARWCQGSWAKDAAGQGVDEESPTACRWCLDGAALKVSRHTARMHGDLWNVLSRAAKDLGYVGHMALNDEADHATVLRCIDLAISQTDISTPLEDQS